MPSELQRVAGELVACLDMMPRVIDALHARARRGREAAGYVGGLSSGSPALQAAAYHLDAAATECEKAAHFAERAYRDARGWAAAMVGGEGGARPSGQRGGSGPSGGQARPGPTEAAKPKRLNGPGPSVPRPPKDGGDPTAQTIIRRLPPRVTGTEKTRGFWRSADGGEKELVSGRGEYQRAADEHAKRMGLPLLDNASHVEVKFAMFMRRHGLRNETIFINNDPCSGQGSCPEWIEWFLPQGAKLTVHWPGGGPWTFEGKAEE